MRHCKGSLVLDLFEERMHCQRLPGAWMTLILDSTTVHWEMNLLPSKVFKHLMSLRVA